MNNKSKSKKIRRVKAMSVLLARKSKKKDFIPLVIMSISFIWNYAIEFWEKINSLIDIVQLFI